MVAVWLLALQLQVPPPVGYVNDFANVVGPDAMARIVAVIDHCGRVRPVRSSW